MAYTTIDDPSAHFQAIEYNGSGGLNLPHNITNPGNSNLQPDFVWIKDREAGYSHAIFDSSRGQNKLLYPDVSNTEVTTGANNDFLSFNTNGFSVGAPSDANSTNGGTTRKAAWQWKANGGTTSSNTDGDITSTVQVNQEAGFSIILDGPHGNTNTRAIGHGLGATPGLIIRRARNRGENWNTVPAWAKRPTLPGGFWGLDTTSAYNDTGTTGVTAVSSTTFTVASDYSVNGNYNYVTYCWAPIKGYSKFGNYWGNGNADGPFVYCGFQPAFIIIKRIATSSYSGWSAYDSAARGNGNTNLAQNLQLHAEYAEGKRGQGSDIGTGVTCVIDINSSGFKIRDSGSDEINDPFDEYVYFAWAEHPFVSSSGIPTTAR